MVGQQWLCNGMAKTSPSSAGGTDPGGAGQAVVELCDATPQGMIFWSRQRFEIGAELQIRVRLDALPDGVRYQMDPCGGWISLRGYVVQCQPERRSNGSFGFRVSLLLASSPRSTHWLCKLLRPADEVFLPGDGSLGRLNIGKN